MKGASWTGPWACYDKSPTDFLGFIRKRKFSVLSSGICRNFQSCPDQLDPTRVFFLVPVEKVLVPPSFALPALPSWCTWGHVRSKVGCSSVCVGLRQKERERTAEMFRARIYIYCIYIDGECQRDVKNICRQTDACLCFLCLRTERGAYQ